jgi:hypothetical protein
LFREESSTAWGGRSGESSSCRGTAASDGGAPASAADPDGSPAGEKPDCVVENVAGIVALMMPTSLSRLAWYSSVAAECRQEKDRRLIEKLPGNDSGGLG